MYHCEILLFGSDKQKKSILLRSRILREPLGLEFSPLELENENNQIHIGLFNEQTLCGILLLNPVDNKVIKMRQVAIDSLYQGKGLGKILVDFAEAYAKENGFQTIRLHARSSAVPFYLKANYVKEETEFIEVGIPHFKMYKNL